MSDFRRKLERISAVRTGRPSARPLAAVRPELVHLLPARIAQTRSGEHLVVSSDVSLPPLAASSDALAILSGHPHANSIAPARWLFLDTETTGLAGGTGTYAFLVGVAQWAEGRLRIDQYFMRHHAEERSLLEAVADRLAQAELLITFNGKAFDLPLLETRFRLARLEAPIPPVVHLDLLYPARQLWRRRLGTVRLSELDRHVLRREREGDVPGEQIPQIYFDYLRTGDPHSLLAVFRHNQYDLEALAALLSRVFDVVKSSEARAAADAAELFGLSRLLEKRGVFERSRQGYERALERGLPTELEPTALRRLAALWKRTREYSRAIELWQRWCRCDVQATEPEVELAIYYEHRSRDYAAALESVQRGLAKLEEATAAGNLDFDSFVRQQKRLRHRQARLERKRARSPAFNLRRTN